MCWCVDVLMCWCVDVLMCWCVDVLMCWCVDVLMCWCVDVDVLMCWCVDVFDVLMWWCVMLWGLCWRVDDCVDDCAQLLELHTSGMSHCSLICSSTSGYQRFFPKEGTVICQPICDHRLFWRIHTKPYIRTRRPPQFLPILQGAHHYRLYVPKLFNSGT